MVFLLRDLQGIKSSDELYFACISSCQTLHVFFFIYTVYGQFLMKWLNLPGFVSTEESLCACTYNFDSLEGTQCPDS